MGLSSAKSRWWFIAVFASGVACVLSLKFLGKHDLIQKQTEGLLTLLFIGGLGTALIVNSIRTPIPPWLRLIILLTIATALAETVLDYAEDMPGLSNSTLTNRSDPTRRTLESVLAAGWICGGFATVYLCMNASRRWQESNRLVDQLRSSEEELKQSNERLATTLEELEHTRRQLIQRERLSALGTMASGVAHDLNNTLAPVLNYSRLLTDSQHGERPEEERQWLICIEQCVRDALSTIDGLQQFYHRDVNSSSLQLVGLGELVCQVIDMTRPKWKDEPEQSGRSISLDVDLPECSLVRVNPAEIRSVITNLIFNAVEAMPDGGTLTFRLYEEGEDVVLSVSDTGRRMSDEALLRCFEPFYTSKRRGSGLGLSICHGIIDRHAGTIHVESDDRGSTFTVRLAAAAAVGTQPATVPPRRQDGLGPQRILLIEDDDLVRESTRTLLDTLGTQVVAVADGHAGVAAFRDQGPFDLVITDLGMAGMDGREVMHMIRQQNPNQKVAIMSGWWDPEIQVRFSDGESPDILLHKFDMSDQLVELFGLVGQPDAVKQR